MTVHTIYPPVAEGAFVGMRLLGGDRDDHRPLQVTAAAGVLAVAVLLLWRARRRGLPEWWVAVWALSPLVAVEATNNAHIDWLAVLAVVGGLLALEARRSYAAGLAFGAAVATKLFPVVLLATAGRRPWRILAGVLTVLVLGYLPHVLTVGPAVLGYLPGYLREEEYAGGGRYLVTGLLLGDQAAAVLTPVLLAVGLLVLWWRADPDRPDLTAVSAVGLYLALTTPNYPWYPLLLVVLVAATGRLRWLWLCLAPTLTYLAPGLPWSWDVTRLVGYGGAVALVLVASVRRARSAAATGQSTATDGGQRWARHSSHDLDPAGGSSIGSLPSSSPGVGTCMRTDHSASSSSEIGQVECGSSACRRSSRLRCSVRDTST
ncbi:glycosyltransferase 87 family protein [Luteipulveratus flavus]|uniref:Glycosyltransferase family 87 protein n=1 Tax=Luteipulveratus flavus TaxID=3031728 RepID=A0ABT6C1P3_9MICO|nr:glycosyltransferase family 87 protein [Luteipulveratus sp. YIM 133296]MDF8262687.1 glycosyltransferase family 87 protein [Luteipulveratus sp. YIM 133296]